MLYRLRPPADVTWCDYPVRDILDLAAQSGADLDRLDWRLATDTTLSSDLLGLALKHGVATGSGIVLDGQYVYVLGRPDQLRTTLFASDQAHHELRESNGVFMEQVLPGSRKHGEELDRKVRESTAPVVQEAVDNLTRALAAPTKRELEQHWEQLGGQLPD
jgi:hypothetical protein